MNTVETTELYTSQKGEFLVHELCVNLKNYTIHIIYKYKYLIITFIN